MKEYHTGRIKPKKRHKGPPDVDLYCPLCGDKLLFCHHKGDLSYPLWSLHCPTCGIMICMQEWSAGKNYLLKLWQRTRNKKTVAAWNKRS